MYVTPRQAARMLDDFMLGAVMQQDPLLEEFGNMPDEPQDDDPAWDMPDADESGGNPSLEQGTLFEMPSRVNRKDNPHPKKHERTNTERRVTPRDEMPPPYVPRHHSLAEHLQWFNGDLTLASHWHRKQSMGGED